MRPVCEPIGFYTEPPGSIEFVLECYRLASQPHTPPLTVDRAPCDPDAILSEIGFGRAHHRVLHFVNRNPGLCVADLLDILKITKQSLGRVLKQLVDEGYIFQREGPSDRRQRLLFPTERGRAMALRLAAPQFARFAAAIDATSEADAQAARRFLMAMVNETERDQVATLLRGDQGSRETS